MHEFGPRPTGAHPDPTHWRAVRAAALARDQGCRLCGDDRELEVHHRTYARWGREALADVTVLCRGCHDLATGAQMRRRDARRAPPPDRRRLPVPAERLPPGPAAAPPVPARARRLVAVERVAWAPGGGPVPPPGRNKG
jgi:hypothetical protein